MKKISRRQKRRWWCGITVGLWLMSGCAAPAPAAVPLSELACRPDDVVTDPPFVLSDPQTAVSPNAPLPDQITDYYSVSLVENALTYTSAQCDLYRMLDEQAALAILTRLCDAAQAEMGPAEPPAVGGSACAAESPGLRRVIFQQGDVVVSIQADLNGFGVDRWAEAVNGRLSAP